MYFSCAQLYQLAKEPVDGVDVWAVEAAWANHDAQAYWPDEAAQEPWESWPDEASQEPCKSWPDEAGQEPWESWPESWQGEWSQAVWGSDWTAETWEESASKGNEDNGGDGDGGGMWLSQQEIQAAYGEPVGPPVDPNWVRDANEEVFAPAPLVATLD